jgi:hypothetical protein
LVVDYALMMRLLSLLLLLATVACQSRVQPLKEVTLPSGRKVKVISLSRINFTNAAPALMLKYQTDLTVSDPALGTEVEDVWSLFRPDVERAGIRSAIVSANEVPHGGLFFKVGKVYNFAFAQSADGTWQPVKPSNGPLPK